MRERFPMIKGIVFDFDGLMVDTESAAYESWMEIYREHNCDLPLTEWAAVLGGSGLEFDPCAYLEQQVGSAIDHAAIRERRTQRKAALVAEQPLLPGVIEYVEEADRRKLKLAVASSSRHQWVDGHLERLGIIDRFDAIICADDVERVKPAPDLYLAAVRALGIEPQEAIALEDAPNGLHAAKRAGLFCVAIPNALTGQLPLDHADLRLVSLAHTPLDTLLVTVEERLHR